MLSLTRLKTLAKEHSVKENGKDEWAGKSSENGSLIYARQNDIYGEKYRAQMTADGNQAGTKEAGNRR